MVCGEWAQLDDGHYLLTVLVHWQVAVVQLFTDLMLINDAAAGVIIPNQGPGVYTINVRRGNTGTPVSVDYAIYNSPCQIVNAAGAVISRVSIV